MEQQVTFSWLCDFIIVARDNNGKEIRRIDFSEVTKEHPREQIIRGKKESDKHSIFMYGGDGSASIATQEGIVESVGHYFQTHDLASFDLWDLWFDIGCDHLCGWASPGAVYD